MDLKSKTIAITGSTGGLGREISFELARSGATIVFVNRNKEKSMALENEIKTIYPGTKIKTIIANLEDLNSVESAALELMKLNIDCFILNAGIYNVPQKQLACGFNNIFTVNFVSQYYLVRTLLERGVKLKKVVALGSIAHFHKKFDEKNIDYSGKSTTKIYGNSKKFLMYSMESLRDLFSQTEFAIAHPGITCTNMTSHYPKAINWFVKFGVKLVFPSPKKACQSVFKALECKCGRMEWFGPKFLDIYGKPIKKKIKHNANELEEIKFATNEIFDKIKKQIKK